MGFKMRVVATVAMATYMIQITLIQEECMCRGLCYSIEVV